jgi:hypothetical protein
MKSFTQIHHWRFGLLAAALAGLAACEAPSATQAAVPHDAHAAATVADAQLIHIEQILGILHRETVRFRNFDVAKNAGGYNTQLTGCMESAEGGMGFHYGNLAYIDGQVDALRPEVLMFEPQKNGDMELVGVEYVVPFTLWTDPNPPQLGGVSFHRNEGFGLWVLHAWIWKQNPSGKLRDWNPRVSCRYAN